MIGQMAIAKAFPGFNDLRSFGDPYFSLHGAFSLPIFYIYFSKEMKKIYR